MTFTHENHGVIAVSVVVACDHEVCISREENVFITQCGIWPLYVLGGYQSRCIGLEKGSSPEGRFRARVGGKLRPLLALPSRHYDNNSQHPRVGGDATARQARDGVALHFTKIDIIPQPNMSVVVVWRCYC